MQKRTWYSVAVFGLLFVASYMALSEKHERGMRRLSFSNLPVDKAEKIEIVHGDDTLALTREGDRWILDNGHRVDPEAIALLLGDIKHIHTTDHVTNDAAHFEELGVGGSKATQITLQANHKTLTHFVVGSMDGSAHGPPNRNFVRQGEDVFRLEEVPLYSFLRPKEMWEDKRVVDDKIENVGQLSIHMKNQMPLSFVRKDQGWVLHEPAETPKDLRFDAQQADYLARSIVLLRATQILADDPGVEKTKLSEGEADKVSWTSQKSPGKQEVLWLGATTQEDGRYAQRQGDGQIFIVSASQLAPLSQGLDAVRALNLMESVDPAAVSELVIKSGAGKQVRVSKTATGTWQWSGAQKLKTAPDSQKVDARIRQTLLARALGVAPKGSKSTALAGSSEEVVLTTSDKKQHRLSFGPRVAGKEQHAYLARGSADHLVYKISAPLRDSLLGGAESLQKSGPVAQRSGHPKGGGLPPEVQRQLEKQLANRP